MRLHRFFAAIPSLKHEFEDRLLGRALCNCSSRTVPLLESSALHYFGTRRILSAELGFSLFAIPRTTYSDKGKGVLSFGGCVVVFRAMTININIRLA
jgi:hypothetical protein